MDIYKIVVKNKYGKVLQIHERYATDVAAIVLSECKRGNRVTVTLIEKE